MHISLLWSSDKLLHNWLSTFRASGAEGIRQQYLPACGVFAIEPMIETPHAGSVRSMHTWALALFVSKRY
jgi:hypothetical protein